MRIYFYSVAWQTFINKPVLQMLFTPLKFELCFRWEIVVR